MAKKKALHIQVLRVFFLYKNIFLSTPSTKEQRTQMQIQVTGNIWHSIWASQLSYCLTNRSGNSTHQHTYGT